jgi:hypothetical protein
VEDDFVQAGAPRASAFFLPLSTNVVEEEFSEVCSLLVIPSSAEAAFPRSRKAMPGYMSHGTAE